jgi:hypothetical protein
MSARTTLAVTLATAGLLGAPAIASARPDDQFDAGPSVGATAPAVQAGDTVVHERSEGPGAGTLTVILVAAGTLVAGAAGGFGGSRVLTRRDALRS